MKVEEISGWLRSLVIQSVELNIQLLKSDLKLLLTETMRKELPKIEQLPKGIKLELIELREISIVKEIIRLKAGIRVLSEKAFIPDSSDLNMDLDIPLRIEDGYLQLNKPSIDITAIEKGWKQKIFQSIINKIIDWNDQKLVKLIDERVNRDLAKPNHWEPKVQSRLQSNNMLVPDYRILSFEGLNTDEIIGLDTTFDIALNRDLRDIKKTQFIQIELLKDELIHVVLKKINSDIKDKLDQEVEILSLDILSENELVARGRAGVMNIQKEFDLKGKLIFDKRSKLLKLTIEEIKVQGGYFIQKGFALVESLIRKKVESAVEINLEQQILNLSIPIKITALERKYIAAVDSIDLSQLSIKSRQNNLIFDLFYNGCSIRIQSITA